MFTIQTIQTDDLNSTKVHIENKSSHWEALEGPRSKLKALDNESNGFWNAWDAFRI